MALAAFGARFRGTRSFHQRTGLYSSSIWVQLMARMAPHPGLLQDDTVVFKRIETLP